VGIFKEHTDLPTLTPAKLASLRDLAERERAAYLAGKIDSRYILIEPGLILELLDELARRAEPKEHRRDTNGNV